MKYAIGYQLMDSTTTFFDIVKTELSSIAEIYFPWVYQSSGRVAIGENKFMIDYTASERLIYDLKKFKNAGIKLDLLFNSNCYGADSISPRLKGEVYSTVDYLLNTIGDLDIVTTTSPVIAFLIKKRYSNIKTRASVNMNIGTISGMRYLSDVYDEFLIQRDYNRDLEYICELKKWADANNKKLHILANSGCLAFCSGQMFHNNVVAHNWESSSRQRMDEFSEKASSYLGESLTKQTIENIESFEENKSRFVSTCLNYFKLQGNLIDLLRATWIRPEDIYNYSELFDVMKLATRSHPNPIVVLKAYSQESWNGNLTELFEPNFTRLIAPYILDNKAFSTGWFKKISSCGRHCESCSYCENTYHNIYKLQGEYKNEK